MTFPFPPFEWTQLHPILVNFTAALVPCSFACDVAGKVLRRESMTSAAWWMLAIAAVLTPFTALMGYLWKRSLEANGMGEGATMQIHQWLGISMAVVLVALVVWRAAFFRRSVVPNIPYLIVAAIIMLALVYQGHLGGSMSF